MKKAIDTIFLDIDGVMVDFMVGLAKLFNKTIDTSSSGIWKNELEDMLGITKRQMWDTINAKGPQFWIDLPLYPWAHDLYAMCQKNANEVIFLTCPSRVGTSLDGKLQWIQKFTGDEKFNNYLMGPAKWACAGPTKVLIDDMQHNTEHFEKSGGYAVLFPQIWNYSEKINIDNKLRYVEIDLGTINNLLRSGIYCDPQKHTRNVRLIDDKENENVDI